MTIRIYQACPLSAHSTVTLDASASHHLARVLRAVVGEKVVLFNGEGGEYAGQIQQIDKKSVTVELETFIAREAESPLDIWLAQGISRGEKMDYTIQKAVELGVKKIIPLYTERCNVKFDEERANKRLAHWQSIVISACEQCGRNRLPEITSPQSFNHWLPRVEADICLTLSPTAGNGLKKLTILPGARVVLLIGPEGGLSEREINQAAEHHFLPLNLGPRILRTETAGLAAITAIQGFFGDMSC